MNWYRDPGTGKIIKVDGAIATDEQCCCGAKPGECCCPQFRAVPVPSMRFTVTGYLVGTVVVPGPGPLIDCPQWGPAQLIIDEEKCDGLIPVDHPSVSLDCNGPGPLEPPQLVAVLSVPLPNCSLITTFVSASCGPKFTSTWSYEIVAANGGPLPPEPCPCVGETGMMTVNEV